MKTIHIFLLVIAACVSELQAGETPFRLTVSIPSDGKERVLQYRYGNTRFHVVLTNISTQPQKIWQEWNSWGYYSLGFELTDSAGKRWFARKKPRGWTRNWHTWWQLAPGESHVFEVDFTNTAIWDGFPRSDTNQKITMRAQFGIGENEETREDGVWTGELSSDAIPVTFWRLPEDIQ